MALVLADRVQETTTSTGTGAVILAGAVNGYQTFSAGVGNGNTCYYTIYDNTSFAWEVGIGTYTSSGNTLTRNTILSSSNSGSAINLAGNTAAVWVDYPSERAVYGNGSVISAPTGALLPLGNGGTNATLTATAGASVYSTGSGLSLTAAGTASQLLQSNGTLAPTWVSSPTLTSLALGFSGTSSTLGALAIGSPVAADTGYLATFAGSQPTYAYVLVQNTSSANTAYSSVTVGNNNYGSIGAFIDIGVNSSTYNATAAGYPVNSLSLANATFIESTNGDISIGSWGANNIHFLVNGTTTTVDAVTINSSSAVGFSGNYGTSGQVLISSGSSSAPTWGTISSGLTITPVSNNATYYVGFQNATSGTTSVVDVATGFTFNPSTGTVVATIFSATSDERLKQDIKTLKNALQKVETMRGVSYMRNGKPEIGLIAQEVERILPEVVFTDDTEYGYKSVSYGSIIGLLIEAVKELSAEVKALKGE